jgi:hypothetical protein
MEKKKLIPYGIQDYVAIRKGNLYYVDKTMFFPEIEKYRYIFLLRPRGYIEIAKNVALAEAQLQKYAIDDKVKKAVHLEPYGDILLKKIAIVFYGWEVVYCEEI